MKSLLQIARAFVGVWGELRRIRLLLEWMMQVGVAARVQIPTLGTVNLEVFPPRLPPTKAESTAAEKETIEYQSSDEEAYATEEAIRILKARAKGESLPDDDPGRDFDLI